MVDWSSVATDSYSPVVSRAYGSDVAQNGDEYLAQAELLEDGTTRLTLVALGH